MQFSVLQIIFNLLKEKRFINEISAVNNFTFYALDNPRIQDNRSHLCFFEILMQIYDP